jgi:oxygen-independent coproporphyrinogen III oxidase
MEKARQAIHTYPFKYQPMTAEEILRPQRAAVYIHVPFCTKKCHFCDFVVRTNTSEDVRQRYVEAVCREIALFASAGGLGSFSVEAIYIGGGTPSLLDDKQLIRLISACRDNFAVADDAELTIEFEPKTVTEEKIAALLRAGLNRASMGVQSFQDELLIASNRSHKVADVDRALEAFRAVGVTNLNVDLIYPLPGLTWDMWASSVDRALAIHPAAISLYALEIWPGTSYDRWNSAGQLEMPGADTEVAMYLHAVQRLEAAGYEADSVNGYVDRTMAAQYCRYLEYYWRLRPLLGFGVSSRSAFGDRLWHNSNSLTSYLAAIKEDRLPIDLGCIMTRQQEMRRFMVRGLKACIVSKAEFLGRFGFEMERVFGAELARLTAVGAITETEDAISLTRKGRAFAPNVYQQFFTPLDLSETSAGEVKYGVSSWQASAETVHAG